MLAADLSDMEAQYEKDREASAWRYVEKQNVVRNGFTNALLSLEAAFKSKGNLDGVVAVRKEREQVVAVNDIKQPEGRTIPEIVDLRARQRKAAGDVAIEEKRAIVAMAMQYVDRLKTVEKELTVADKIDEALVVQQRRIRVMEEPDVVAALSAIKDSVAISDNQRSKPPKPPEATTPRPVEVKKIAKPFPDSGGVGGFGRSRDNVKSSFD